MALGQPSANPLARFLARVLIAALVFASLPQQAFASYAGTGGVDPLAQLPSLPTSAEAPTLPPSAAPSPPGHQDVSGRGGGLLGCFGGFAPPESDP